RVDFGCRFGEQELNALQRCERAAELATLLGVGNGLVERAPGHSDRCGAHRAAKDIEGRKGQLHSVSLAADALRGSDAAIVEHEFSYGVFAEPALRLHAQAG